MNDFKTLKVEKEGNVITATLFRPDARNAINMQMVKELSDLIDVVDEASDVAVLVLRGTSDIFSAGIDLRDFQLDKTPDIYGLQKWEKMCRQLENLNKFTIAAVHGECTGGGFQLVLLCDARVATKKSTFRFNEVKQGFLPGMATFRLAKYVGLGRAKNLILTGRPLGAEEALAWGILDQVCEPTSFDETIQKMIDSMLPFHPVVFGLSRRLINECYATNYENFIGHFLAAQHRAINSAAFHELIRKATSGSPGAK